MSSRFLLLLLTLVVSTFSLSKPAAAQAMGGDVTFGYVFVTNDMLAVNADTLPRGWFGGGTVRLTDVLSIAFTASGAFRTGIEPSDSTAGVVRPGQREEFQGLSYHRPETLWCSPTVSKCDIQIQSVTGGVGPRFTFQTGSVRPFVHVLAGWTRVLRKIEFFTHTATSFSLMPGAGVDIKVNDRWGFRIQGDYSRALVPDPADSNSSFVVKDGKDFNEFRLGIGAVYGLRDW